ncbi:MAG: leucine-rich repeat protein, partial [Prevotella sp.]
MAKKVFVSAMVLVTSCLTAWGQTGYNVTYTNENSFQNMATITKSENGNKTLVEAITEVNAKRINNAAIKKVKIVGDITSDASALSDIKCTTIDLSEATFTSFTNDNVKYVVLPHGWTKEQVNTTAKTIGKSLESAASALGNYTYSDGFEYTDPYTKEKVQVEKGKIQTKDNDTYGLLTGTFSVAPTKEESTYTYVDNGKTKTYNGTLLFNKAGDAFGVNGGGTTLVSLFPDKYLADNANNKYTGTITRKEEGAIYGNTGTAFDVNFSLNGYQYSSNGKNYVYLGDDTYTNGEKLYSPIPNDNIVKLKKIEEYHSYNTDGEVVNIGDYTNVSERQWDDNKKVYYVIGKNQWNNDIWLYIVDAYTYGEANTKYDTTNNPVYTKGEEYYGYTSSENPFKELTELTEKTYFNVETKEIYTGKVYDGEKGGTGEDVALTYVTDYYMDESKTQKYDGPVTTDNKGVENAENYFSLTFTYVYTYNDLAGNEHTKNSTVRMTEIQLTGDELYIAISPVEIQSESPTSVSLTAYVKEPGTLVYSILNMSQLESEYKKDLNVWYVAGEDYKYDYTAMNVKKITLSGNLNAIDLNNGYYITSDEGRLLNYGSGNGALKYCTTPDILDLSDAIFGEGADYHPEDMTISKLFPTLKSVLLPTHESQKVIPADCFYNMTGITDVMIPSHYEVIGERAFKGCKNLNDPKFPSTLKEILSEAYSGALNIKNIKFNDNLEFIGNCAFYCNSAVEECQKTITFPSSLKYMGPGAFYGRRFEDIYFNSVTAPISPIGQISSDTQFYMSAFEDAMHMGNNGFDPLKSENNPNADMANKGFANRENYKNNGGVYFTMLHFPENLTSENVETYTDITREYTTTEVNPDDTFYPAAQLKVGKEEQKYVFNNGQEWSNYCDPGIVNPGFIDTYRGEQYIWPSQSQWMRSFVCNSLGYKWDGVTEYRPQLTEQQIALMIKDGLTIKNVGTITESNKDTYSDELRKIAYMGTRQFVLANGDHEASNEYKVKDIQGGYWWTLCVPFNMTKKQIDDVFGPGTLVCRFSEVERDDDSNEKKITLKFQHDVYAHKTLKEKGIYAKFDKNADPCNDNDTVIYAHESYMIHPTKTNADAVFVVKNYEPIAGSPLPTIVKANDNTEYRFIGNYTVEMSGDETVQMQRIRTVTIPKYSYMYAKKKNEDISMYKFWFYNGGSLKWSSNKCVVQATAKDGGYKDYENFFGTTSQAKQVSIFGSDDIDDKPTEIEHVEIIAGEQP